MSLYVKLTPEEMEILRDLAWRARRPPRMQAEFMLTEALRKAQQPPATPPAASEAEAN